MMKTNIRIIHGNRIGGCITVISTEKSKIIIDFGESLPGSELEGDISFDWEKEKADAVLFTHYHGDHIGRFAEIPASVPLYMGSVTYQIMKNINQRIGNKDIVSLLENRGNLFFIEPCTVVKIGDVEVIPYSVDHSAFDAYMFLVIANGECILHTGDYRDHGHRGHTKRKDGSDRNIMLDVIKYYVTDNGKRRINALITEGTMMTRLSDKRYSEKQMLNDAKLYFSDHRYVFLKISSTNVDSLASFAKAAQANGIKMYVNSYQLKQIEVFRGAGKKHHTTMYAFENVLPLLPPPDECKSDVQRIGSVRQRKHMREDGFLIVADGYYEKYLTEFSDLPITSIYSMWHGYIEPDNPAFNERLHEFCRRTQAISMHTSGHAYPEFIEQVIQAVNPTEAIIPIHTEAKNEFFNLGLSEDLKGKIKAYD